MRRLFLKVYLGIALVLILGTTATIYLLTRRIEAVRTEAMESRMAETLIAIRERAEQDPFGVDTALYELGRAFRMRVEVLPGTMVDPALRERLETGEAYVEWTARGPHVYALLSDGRVLMGRGGGRRGGPGRERYRGPRGGDGPPPDEEEWRPPPEWGGPPRQPDDPGLGQAFRAGGPYFVLLIVAVPILLMAPAIFLMIRPVDKRVRALSDVAQRFGEGRLDARADVTRRDALSDLAGTFNRMAERIEILVTGQKELMRAVSHELRTPLARLFFILDDAEAARTEEERKNQLNRMQAGLTEMNELVEELLSFVRLDSETVEGAKEDIDLAAALENSAQVGRDLRDALTIEVRCRAQTIRAVPRYATRAIVNLVTNAARHASSRVVVGAEERDGWVDVTVDDDGTGVPAAARERIFEPFTRVDSARNAAIGGAGLGLAIVARIMALHDGKAEVEDSPLGGARFRLRFPR